MAATFISMNLVAQSPQKMSYQAVVRNITDQLVVNTSVGMQVSILQNSTTGDAVYVERHFPTTNANGLVSIEIGTGITVSGSFVNIEWQGGPYFLKTETDLNGGATYTITGTSELLSVPYALFALKTESFYSQSFFGLNHGEVTVSNEFTILNTGSEPHSFYKSRDDTKIEVHINSRFYGGTFESATGISFAALIDGEYWPDNGNIGSIITSNTNEFLSIYLIFETGIPAGNHTINIVAQTNQGTSSRVLADPGGFGGSIVVTEKH